MNQDCTDLLPHRSALELVEVYQKSRGLIKEAFEKIKEAKTLLTNSFGVYRDSIFPHNFNDTNLIDGMDGVMKTVEVILRQNFWRHVVEKTEVSKIMSVARFDKLHAQLYPDQRRHYGAEIEPLPEPSTESVMAFFDSNFGRAREFVAEAVMELFDYLRPDGAYNRERYKSNKLEEIGKRVCRTGVMCYRRVNEYHRQKLQAVENMFFLMDGKRPPKYPEDAVSLIEKNFDRGFLETEYFRFRWFKNQALHLEFRRLDLLAKFNAEAGKAFMKAPAQRKES